MVESISSDRSQVEPLNPADTMPEADRPNLASRIKERLDGYFHPVSNEAVMELEAVCEALPQGMLSATLKTVEPSFRNVMKGRDRSNVFFNLLSTGVRLAFGVGFFTDSVRDFTRKSRLTGFMNAALGLGFTGSAVRTLFNAGSEDKARIRQASETLQRYYATEVGQNAARGKGHGEAESLTHQVDRIVAAISLGDIPSISGVQPR